MFEIISAEKVARVAVMAREIERDGPQLYSMIDRMAPEEQAALTAIMWIGRGSFDVDEVQEALFTANAEATSPTADYLLGTPHLSENLEAGMDALGEPVTELEDAVM